MKILCFLSDLEEFPAPLSVMFWLYGGGFVMGDATEENYLPGPLLDTNQVVHTFINKFNMKKKLIPWWIANIVWDLVNFRFNENKSGH